MRWIEAQRSTAVRVEQPQRADVGGSRIPASYSMGLVQLYAVRCTVCSKAVRYIVYLYGVTCSDMPDFCDVLYVFGYIHFCDAMCSDVSGVCDVLCSDVSYY